MPPSLGVSEFRAKLETLRDPVRVGGGTVPVLQEVLVWSERLPAWQRDALRRIVLQPELSSETLDQLAELCKKAHGLSTTEAVAQPLAIAHVPPPTTGSSIALKAVEHVSDVNALAPGQEVSFGTAGLTVVFGSNGAGKSGYARILKRACRARGNGDPVLPNALSEVAAGTPTAKITLSVNGTETTHTWRDGIPCASELAAVSVFDSSAAQVYVANKTEVAYRPLGLDVLDRLAAVCNQLRGRFESEKSALERAAAPLPAIPPMTAAGRLVASLTALTRKEDVELLANLTDAERREATELEAVLAAARVEDPVKRSGELRLKAARVRKLREHLKVVSDTLGLDAVQALNEARKESAACEEAALAAQEAFAGTGLLPDVGGGAWRKLWEAARNYSEGSAYRGVHFPHVGHDARCVLCQQELNLQGRARLQSFDAFVRGEAQATARIAMGRVQELRGKIDQVHPLEGQSDIIDDITAAAHDVGGEVLAFLSSADQSRRTVLERVKTPEDPLVPFATPAPVAGLDQVADDWDRRAAELTKAADPEHRKNAEARLAELHARAKLAENRAAVLGEIDRKARLNAFDRCLKDTNSAAVTRESTELTKKYVTEALAAAFDDELKKLGFNSPELVLRPAGGQKGALYHQTQLKHVTRAELPRIVSEGEARCLALAAFLAELRTAGGASGIVFDDPVSSLDHNWRARVAKRLVQEAATRQVIVFTHELVFLSALVGAAGAAGISCTYRSLRRQRGTTGHVDEQLPWAAQPTKSRLGTLRDAWQRAEKVYRLEGHGAYEPLATQMYARLRQAWERAIEEVLLHGVVMRFRDGIETKRLAAITDLCSADYEAVEAGMTKSSKWEGGHDHALAANEPIPPPDELEKDIELLETWVRAIQARRSAKK